MACILSRYRMAVGIQGDSKLFAGSYLGYGCDIIGERGKLDQTALFFAKHFNGFSAGFTMNTDVGYVIKPVDGGRVNDFEVGYFKTCQEVFLT